MEHEIRGKRKEILKILRIEMVGFVEKAWVEARFVSNARLDGATQPERAQATSGTELTMFLCLIPISDSFIVTMRIASRGHC